MNPSQKKPGKPDKGDYFIGTSNIVLLITKEQFHEAFAAYSQIHYYATLFNSLEVNASFYKVPRKTTFENWGVSLSSDFRFAVKVWKEISHATTSGIDPKKIHSFMDAVNGMPVEKRGCLLLQFPASFRPDKVDQLEKILQLIRQQDPDDSWTLAVELRHTSWYNTDTDALLEKYGCTLVLHDMPASALTELRLTTQTVYLRFHGQKGDYKGTYSDKFLADVAGKMQQWGAEGKDVYVYFNNTLGQAYDNAKTLQQLVAPK